MPFNLPLSPTEFRDALDKGLGRAFLHVREHGDAGIEDVLLDAAAHNRVFDHQSEGLRGVWVARMVEGLPAADRYEQACLASMRATSARRWDADREHARQFALERERRGSAAARQGLYDGFRVTLDPERKEVEWDGTEEIVELDGFEGLLFAVSKTGEQLAGEPRDVAYSLACIDYPAEDLGGIEGVLARLVEAGADDPGVLEFLTRFEAQKLGGSEKASAPRARARKTFAELLEHIEAAGGPLSAPLFARPCAGATAEEREEVYRRLLKESRPAQLARYLACFTRCGGGGSVLPAIDDRVLECVHHEDAEVRSMAYRALSQVKDPRVRAVAVREVLLPRHPDLDPLLDLFQVNWEPGDETLIEQALWIPDTPGEVHGIAGALANLLELHPSEPALANLALWLYEQSPCSYCRSGAVEQLLTAGTIPGWLRAEAEHDGYEEIRRLVGDEGAAVAGR